MATEMTPQERADLKEIARKLVLQINEITPMQWGRYDDKDQAIVLAALQTTRRAALLEAAQQVCMHCGKRAIGLQVGVTGPNAAGNYVHNPPEDSRVKESALCSATSIWSLIRYEDRLAQEG